MSPRLRYRAGGALSAAVLLAIPAVLVFVLFGGSHLGNVFATESADPATADVPAVAPAAAQSTAPAPASQPSEEPRFEFPTPMPAPAPEEAAPAEVRTALRPDASPLDLPPSSRAADELLGRERYDYRSLGRRDPFRSLVSGEFLRGQGGDLIDVGDMRLVGVSWSRHDRQALVEDSRGFGYILRVGDPVRNGTIIDIDERSITVEHTLFGQTEIMTIPLNRREGEGHE